MSVQTDVPCSCGTAPLAAQPSAVCHSYAQVNGAKEEIMGGSNS